MKKYAREYFKLRNPEQAGNYGEFYTSRNGTDQWSTLAKIKAMITRGQAGGYKGQIRTPFDGFEVVQVTEVVQESRDVLAVVVDGKLEAGQ